VFRVRSHILAHRFFTRPWSDSVVQAGAAASGWHEIWNGTPAAAAIGRDSGIVRHHFDIEGVSVFVKFVI
jgi:hypothetical protein